MAESTRFWGMVPTILKMSKDPNKLLHRAISWLDRAEDFQGHGNISKACAAECCENPFTRPVLGVW